MSSLNKNATPGRVALATPEGQNGVDYLLVQSLGRSALTATVERSHPAHSRTFEGLNVSEQEMNDAISLVESALHSPGVLKANEGLQSQGDTETIDHEYRVAVLATIAARRANCSEDEVGAMAIAGLIHDNGKAQGPAAAANRKSTWDNPQDRLDMETHPTAGVHNARECGVDNVIALDLTGTHHEALRVNEERGVHPYGISYVGGVRVEVDHPASARLRRLLSACDYIDARCNPRHYRDDGQNITAPQAIARLQGDLHISDEVAGVFNDMVTA